MLVLAVVQIGPDTDPEPALTTLAAARRVLVRPPSLAALPVSPGIELTIDPELDRATIAARVRRDADDLVTVLVDDERLSPELAAALLARGNSGPPGAYVAARRVRFLGRDIRGAPMVLAWRGNATASPPTRLPGAIVTVHARVAATIERLEALATRTPPPAAVGAADFVRRPLAAVIRRLWLRRRDGIPGVILSIIETYGEVLAAAQVWERHGLAARRVESRRGIPPGFHLWRTPWSWLTLRDGTPVGLREALLAATPDTVAGEPMAGGRGAVWALPLGGTERGVLRWYRRGGALRHVIRDRYFGVTPRPVVELAITEAVRARGVAVPEVLATRVDRLRWGWYRGAIVTRELTGAVTFAAALRLHPNGPERVAVLTAVGRGVRHLHDRGVDHRDLNATNMLLTREDALTVWFIDFDRAIVRPRLGSRVRARALRRLERSLAKLARAGMPFAAADAAALRQAYDETPAPPERAGAQAG